MLGHWQEGRKMTIAFTFPGQGSQAVGMGKALAERFTAARAVFAEVDEALGQKLSLLMWEGPEADLTLTENAQPALMAVSMAVIRVLEAEYAISVADTAFCVAGHSLGEYSALAAAGTFSLADAARLLKIRGRAMQAATPVGTGAMAALLGLDFASASAVAAEAAESDVCQAANDNSDGQVVISGHKQAVERALVIAKTKGAKRAILLPVSAPFHCALMQPAADAMERALAEVAMRAPSVPLIANVTAAPLRDPADIRASLVKQVTGTVRWRECVAAMAAAGVDRFLEAGAGKVLTGLLKKNAPAAQGFAVGVPEDFEAAVAQLREH
jgi:[acyl-carrier-protein] S-malonyltransferase